MLCRDTVSRDHRVPPNSCASVSGCGCPDDRLHEADTGKYFLEMKTASRSRTSKSSLEGCEFDGRSGPGESQTPWRRGSDCLGIQGFRAFRPTLQRCLRGSVGKRWRRTPQRVGPAHLPNQSANLANVESVNRENVGVDQRSPRVSPRLLLGIHDVERAAARSTRLGAMNSR